MVELITMHDAAPTRYIPDTVTLLDEPTGVPGDWIRYRSIDGQKPTESRGINPPESLFKRMDQCDAKMQEVSGLNSVLSGQRPSGDPTLGEVQILEERGMATFRSPLDSLIAFERDLSFMLLSIARQSAWSPRFRRLRGENSQWEIKQFAAADLSGQVDIVVDRASAWPRSPLMQQLRLREALSQGVLPPPAQDPELQGKLLVEMNLAHLKPSYDVDRRQVAREIDGWKAATDPSQIKAPNPQTQNLPIHLHFKQQFMKTEEAEALETLNFPVWSAMLAHIQQIQNLLQPPVPMPPDPPPAPGSQGALDRELDTGRLTPDTGEAGQGGALEQAIAAGTLVPDDGTATSPGQPGLGGHAAAPTMAGGPSIDQISAEQMRQPLPQPGEEPLGGAPV